MITRRTFLKYTGGTALTLYAVNKFGLLQALGQIQGGTLNPNLVPKYQTPLLIPPVMPKAGTIVAKGGKNIDYYEISMKQFQQQILPESFPTTTVWGYGPKVAQDGPQIFNAPSLTIEAKVNRPVRIKWINELLDANGNYLPHLLPVDQTIHWANPSGDPDGIDMHGHSHDPYLGPVPMVPHLHGAHTHPESDGFPEAWFLPAANDIPAGYATVGTHYEAFRARAEQLYGQAWEPGGAVFQYDNDQPAATLWYHDHTLGMTRLNVYAGPAGFYLLRGGIAWHNLTRERRRLAISVGGVAFAVLLIVLLRGLYSGFLAQATEYIRSVDAELWVAQSGTSGDLSHSVSL